MRYKASLFSIIILSFLFSCTNKQDLSFSKVTYTIKDFDCTTDCPEINIQQLKAISPNRKMDGIAANTNQALNEHLIYSLFSYDEDLGGVQDVKTAIQKFITGYQEDKLEYPDMMANYEAMIESEVLHQSENMLSIKVITHLYTGGAHGYTNISYQNFNPKDGYPIGIEHVLVDIDTFIDFVEIKFREAYNIPDTSDLNATRFMFDENVFILPSSIGFDKENMLFTYNPYEIAPYSEGPIELKIPIKEIQVFLKKEFDIKI